MANKKKWLELGNLIRNTTDREGKPIAAKDQRTYLKLSDEVFKVLKDAGYDVGQVAQLSTPVENVERLIKAGVIEEGKVESRREAAKGASSWLKYIVQLPPPRVD